MSDPSAQTAVSPAVSQLAAWWQHQDDATKLIFNQLYREVPDSVLKVLTQGQLAPDPAHSSIDQIVVPAGDNAASEQPRVDILINSVEPQYPKADEDFTVTWQRLITGTLPAHSDAVQILDAQGTPVDERPIARSATSGAGQETVTEKFQGLPTGTYTVVVWGNIEGSDGTGVPTAQGMRGAGSVPLYVGDTRDAQIAQTSEPAMKAAGELSSAQFAAGQIAALWDGASLDEQQVGPLDERFRTSLAAAAAALRDVSSLGDGFQSELYRIGARLNSPAPWHVLAGEGELNALVQRLSGVVSMNIVAAPGEVGFALIDIVDKLYE